MFELQAKSSKETDILMYGSISEWGRVKAEDLFNKLAEAKSKGYEKVNLKINSPGGSIFEGIACLAQMNSQALHITGTVEGLAASMASAMLQGCHKRRMVKGGRLMVHQGSGGVFGSANFIRNYADLLESLNKTLADIYASTTKKEPKWILENWMKEGVDTWFTAEQALKEGLIDEIVEGNVKPLEKETASLLEMAAHYQAQLETKDEMKKDEAIKLLGLKAEATDQEVLDAIKAAVEAKPKPATPPAGEGKAGEGKDTPPTSSKLVEGVIALAKANGMTDEKQLEALKAIAATNPDAAVMLISKPGETPAASTEADKNKEPLSLNDLIDAINSGKGGSTPTGNKKDWKLSDWEKNDQDGLMNMIKTKPGEYAKLFEAQHGYKPSEDEIKKLIV